MTMAQWLKWIGTAVGVIALAVLIWFAGPLFAFNDVRPLESAWVRLGLILLIVLTAIGVAGVQLYRRKQASEQIERALSAGDEEDSDVGVLQETMKDALATLKRAKGSTGDYLYDLPWYVIIGPPGSGKTTALINSGLKFPLARGATPEAIAGVGGTRYCDWWFTENAVLIDTAGRYTTQDSDAKADRTSWLSFLDLLKKNRPKQPINGVLVAISIEDLLTSSPEEISAHAAAIRKRLLELHEHLKVDFPVYALFTKADLIAGFMEFFQNYNETERRMVWGHTFQTNDKTKNMIGEVPGEYDALIERLTEQLPDRLQGEPTPSSRVILFGFPSQVAALKKQVLDFLNRIFEPSRYHSNATLRGFYFTSGTQQGTPIDQLIGALSRNFGAQEIGQASYSGLGKSFFLTDLLTKVIFGEAGWVSTNRAAVRRGTMMKAASYGGITVAAIVATTLWWISYTRNRELILATNNAVSEYRTLAAPVIREATVSDRNFGKVLPLLHKLRHMPTGYELRDESVPVSATFGLSQHDRLESASMTTYQVALERMFRARLIFRMEEQIEANISNPGFVYEALKVYMMLGAQVKTDRDLVLAWMRRDWAENIYPGAANAKGREALEEHLTAMLDLEQANGVPPLISLNRALIEDAQRTLARMSVAERAYELLKSQARGASHKDWVVGYRGGPDVGQVFEGAAGEDLESIRVPYFYTYEGFHNAFIDRLGDIGETIEKERWVLGTAGEQAAVVSQYATLFQDLLKLYTRDFVAAWQQTLRKLKLRPMNADKPKYVALSAAAAPTSPIKQLLESIRDETRLTRERPAPKQAGGAAGGGGAGKAAAAEAERRASAIVGGPAASIGRMALENQAGGGGSLDRFGTTSEVPGANIEGMFKQFHVLVEGDAGRRPIDALLQNLSEINHNLAIAATNPSQAAAANNALVQSVASLRANASRFPAPFEAMVRAAANDFEGDATGVTINNIQQALAEQVTRICQQIVPNRYPFVRGSDREIPIADFARLFAPSGIIDKFVQQHVAHYIDTSKKQWTWRVDSRIARSLSPATLRELQRAAEIKEAFFPTGGTLPSFTMTVTPLTLSGDAANARLEINGTPVNTQQQGVNAPANVQWPGGGIPRSSITLGGGGGGGFFGGGFFSQAPTVFARDGAWSFFRMLDAGAVLPRGDNVVATFSVGGKEVSYQFNVGSLMNPLILPALREFRCPTGI